LSFVSACRGGLGCFPRLPFRVDGSRHTATAYEDEDRHGVREPCPQKPPVYSNMGARSIPGIIIWLLCRLLRPLLGAETWDRRCACASGWSIYGLQPLKAGRGDSLVPLVQLLSIGNLVRTEVKLAAAAAVPLVKYAAEETTMASRDDSWRQETDPAGRSTAAPRRTIRTQEPARI
jgi:hypothetical protein